MLSLTLPTLTEEIILNGVALTVYPLPLYFRQRVRRIYPSSPSDEKDSPARTFYLQTLMAVIAVEALRLSGEVDRGRPDWGEMQQWQGYALGCVEALDASGFTATHIAAIVTAADALEDRKMEDAELVGNS